MLLNSLLSVIEILFSQKLKFNLTPKIIIVTKLYCVNKIIYDCKIREIKRRNAPIPVKKRVIIRLLAFSRLKPHLLVDKSIIDSE